MAMILRVGHSWDEIWSPSPTKRSWKANVFMSCTDSFLWTPAFHLLHLIHFVWAGHCSTASAGSHPSPGVGRTVLSSPTLLKPPQELALEIPRSQPRLSVPRPSPALPEPPRELASEIPALLTKAGAAAASSAPAPPSPPGLRKFGEYKAPIHSENVREDKTCL